jgi:hypothetical protein
MEILVLAAVAATVLWFAAFIGLLASAPTETAADHAAAAQRPQDPLGRSFLIAARTAILVFLGAWMLYAGAETLSFVV